MDDIQRFIGGFRRFQHKYFGERHKLFDELKQGQSPKTLLIGCSDSRVDPALLTDCKPGDIFVVRNVANLVPPFENDNAKHGVSAAIEFAVCDLEVRQVVVMGHSSCGGISSLMHGHPSKTEVDFVGKWMQIAEPARQHVKAEMDGLPVEEQIRACEMAAIIVSLDNLMTFPFIAERVEAGKLSLIGWYFDMQKGELYDFDQESNAFKTLVTAIEK